MNTKCQLRWLFVAQAVLLAIAGWRNVHQLNPDAIAYLRIAGYYAAGQVELAVTGYWGPLLSWLMVPLLKAGVAPLLAARVVMAGAGVVFLAGSLAVFRAFRLPPVSTVVGASVVAGYSVFWSVRNITPDLLMAGLVALAVSATVRLFLSPGQRTQGAATASCRRGGVGRLSIVAGAWWGVAYLAKAVALPLAVLTTLALAGLALRRRAELRREVAQRLGLLGLGAALVAGPWVGMLSLHYGKFTFSTTGPIAHALAGPGAAARYHPAMVTLHQPEVGRLTQWEEPSRMAYRLWSPFASAEHFQHQLAVMQRNVATLTDWLWGVRWLSGAEDSRGAVRMLPGFDLLGASLAGVFGGVVVLFVSRRRPRRVRWSWAVVPVVGLAGLYLPFWVQPEDQRYFYGALPFVWVLVLGSWRWVCEQGWDWTKRIRQRVFRVAGVAFVIPAALWLGVGIWGIPNAANRMAHALAAQLKVQGQSGPLAGSAALSGGRTGLYTAFHLGERWLGDDVHAGPADFELLGTRTVVLLRGSRQAEAFGRSVHWRRLEAADGVVPVVVFLRTAAELR